MATIILETFINAPVEMCFDGARDIGLHVATASKTGERAIAGVTSGLIEQGQEVTFEAVHFGVKQRLTGKITEFDRPHRFVDETVKSIFRSFRHVHEFMPQGEGTLMRDTMSWVAPLGPLGGLADWLFLRRHMTSFLRERNAALKTILEQRASSAAR